MKIDPRRTFRMVIEGSPNRDAIAIARCAASRAGTRPNPLLIRGNTGVGKSLLLHAAANELARRNLALASLTAEELANAYVEAIRGRMREFRDRIARCDALVVDELEDLETWPHTFAELQRAIQQFVDHDKPVLLATGPAWNEALEWLMRELPRGRIAVLQPPTQKQRMAALQRACGVRRKRLSRAALLRIARRTRTIADARAELERALIERAVGSASARVGTRLPRAC